MNYLKRHQIAGANYHYTKHPFSYFVEAMKRFEIRHIEMYAASPHLYLYDYTPNQVYSIKRQLDQAGIRVECFTAEQCFYPISIAIDDPVVRERSIPYYERALEQAAVLESPYMQMISGSGFIGSDPSEDRKRSADAIHRIVKTAEKLGVTIVLEADRTCTVRNTAEAKAMIDEIGNSHFSGMIDTNAIYHAKEDFESCVTLLGKDLRHIHFIDMTAEAGCLVPGSGILPMAEYMDILARHGYEGYLTPELWGWRYTDQADDAMRKSLDFCHQYTK